MSINKGLLNRDDRYYYKKYKESKNNEEKKLIIGKINDDSIKLNLIVEEKSQDNIYLLLSSIKKYEYKFLYIEYLKSNELKGKILNETKNELKKIRGIEELYSSKDISNIIKGVFPEELTYGIEIETIGENTSMFLNNFKFKEWVTKHELCLNDKGFEMVSPIMTYNKEDLSQIKKMCNFLKENGFGATQNCGGHIHYGFDYFDSSKDFFNLIILYSYFEKELYMISNNEKDNLRPAAIRYAGSIIPLVKNINLNTKENYDDDDLIDNILGLIEDNGFIKKLGLNLYNIGTPNKNTIEFRIPNGTIEYEDWNKNIILFGSLIKYSKYISNDLNINSNIHDSISRNESSEKRANLLMDYLFEDNETLKKDYLNRYYSHIRDKTIKKLKLEPFNLSNYSNLRKITERN